MTASGTGAHLKRIGSTSKADPTGKERTVENSTEKPSETEKDGQFLPPIK